MLGIPALRMALGLTQADVCRKVAVILGQTFTVGALSAIEKGHRGASDATLRALEVAFGIPQHSLEVDYETSHERRKTEDPAA